jgi:hypothetical protein
MSRRGKIAKEEIHIKISYKISRVLMMIILIYIERYVCVPKFFMINFKILILQ